MDILLKYLVGQDLGDWALVTLLLGVFVLVGWKAYLKRSNSSEDKKQDGQISTIGVRLDDMHGGLILIQKTVDEKVGRVDKELEKLTILIKGNGDPSEGLAYKVAQGRDKMVIIERDIVTLWRKYDEQEKR